ncbi:hypothetical protein EVAR_46735_1 [Eumeta japonica]|uniref:Uncharacterized protein n=1 Tax=Eumeta variegata TaxID=151549 RepID=A0A4C1X9S8_EUMVA|nr:hypothetical protein EVAR_46735_1 [Eumeta japonica]
MEPAARTKNMTHAALPRFEAFHLRLEVQARARNERQRGTIGLRVRHLSLSYLKTSTTDKKDERTEINRPWQNDHIQTKRKAELSPELANRSNKLTKTTYAVTTHNRFQDLETENNEGPPEQHKEPKPPKPEPIFVTGVLDIKKLKELCL